MKFILCALICMSTQCFALGNGPAQVMTLLSGATTTATSVVIQPWAAKKTFHAVGTTSAGSGAATIKIEGANTNSSVTADWVLLGTITLTLGTTSTGDGFSADSEWKYLRARISAISGTTATVSVYAAAESNK